MISNFTKKFRVGYGVRVRSRVRVRVWIRSRLRVWYTRFEISQKKLHHFVFEILKKKKQFFVQLFLFLF